MRYVFVFVLITEQNIFLLPNRSHCRLFNRELDLADKNKRQCPLCRMPWPGDPEVVDWEDLVRFPL